MGCWNETCGITQLPIFSGEPVALILLSNVAETYGENPEGHAGFSYPNQIWTPRALPIFGRYNDYGSIEDIQEGWNTEFIVNGFRDDLVEKEVGKNTSHDPAVNKSQLSIDNILEWIHESRLEVKGASYQKLPHNQAIGWMMVHGKVYDHLCSKVSSRWQESTDFSKVIRDAEVYYEAVKSSYSEQKARIQERVKSGVYTVDDDKNPEDFVSSFAWAMTGSQKDTLGLDRGNIFSSNRVFQRGSSSIDYYGASKGISDYFELLKPFIEKDEPFSNPMVKEFFEETGRFAVFHNNIDLLRKSYAPQSGKGSQDQSLDELLELNRVVEGIIREHKREWDESEEDEEETPTP